MTLWHCWGHFSSHYLCLFCCCMQFLLEFFKIPNVFVIGETRVSVD